MRWLALAAILVCVLSGCGEDESAPKCDVSPAAIEFGLAFFTGPADSHSVTRNLRVRNVGGQDLEFIAELHAPTGAGVPRFHLEPPVPARFAVAPGDSATISVVLTGTSNSLEGEYDGWVDLGLACGTLPFSAQVRVGE